MWSYILVVFGWVIASMLVIYLLSLRKKFSIKGKYVMVSFPNFVIIIYMIVLFHHVRLLVVVVALGRAWLQRPLGKEPQPSVWWPETR